MRACDLSRDKLVAQADLGKALGTLRYLGSLTAARARKQQQQQQQQGLSPADPQQVQDQQGQQQGQGQGQGQGQEQHQGTDPTGAAAVPTGAVAGMAPGDQPLQPPSAMAAAAAAAAAACFAAAAAASDTAGAAPPALAAAAAPAPAPAAAAPSADELVCPICQESVGLQCVMLPCGHTLCYPCSEALVAALRRVNCPTCRQRHLVSELAYVDNGIAETYGGGSAAFPGEGLACWLGAGHTPAVGCIHMVE